jgi:hypothetical protein
MANTTIGGLPSAAGTVVVNPNGANAAVAVARGVLYRVCAVGTAVLVGEAAYLNYGTAAALYTKIPLPVGSVDYFVFGMRDEDNTPLDVQCFAAAGIRVYFTPLVAVPTN